MPTIERSETRTGTSPWRNRKYISIGLIAFVAAIVIGLAAFPWGALGGTIQKRLSQSLGREVTIGSVERVDHFSLHPVIELRNVTIPQPEWVKNTAPMLHVGRMRIGFAALPVLLGRQRLERIEVADAQALLIRTRNERTNWSGPKDKGGGDGSGPSLGTLRQFSLADVAIDYRDALQNRRFKVRLSGSAQQGLHINGTGEVRGSPVRINASGAPFDRLTNKGRWPFALHVEGKTVGFDMAVAYMSRREKDDLPWPFLADINELAEWADYLVISVPGGAETHHMINRGVLKALGPDGYVVSVGRNARPLLSKKKKKKRCARKKKEKRFCRGFAKVRRF